MASDIILLSSVDYIYEKGKVNDKWLKKAERGQKKAIRAIMSNTQFQMSNQCQNPNIKI
jgi:hypothetical protein